MSMNRLQNEIADLHEINSGIVARQKVALTLLRSIMSDQLDRDEDDEAEETQWVINVLLGNSVAPPVPTNEEAP